MKRAHKYLTKINTPLEELLHEAIVKSELKEVYQHSKTKQSDESVDKYIERIKVESEQFQFVPVKSKTGSIQYAAFGTPGSVINEYGEFWMIPGQIVGGKWGIHYFLIYPDFEKLNNQEQLFIRIDSGCFIGMVFNDNTCDCKQQLEVAMKKCVDNKSGLIIEIPKQDGRGWGEFKMANQRITNELGINTVETARMFYEDDNLCDRRDYDEAALLLKALGLGNKKITLGTNNPKKIEAFLNLEIEVVESQRIMSPKLSDIAKSDLAAKAKEWKHAIIF